MHTQPPISLPFILLSLLTITPVLSQTFTSYNDWVDKLPSCARSCINPLYDDILKSCSATRSSTSHADLVCLCKGGTLSQTEQFNRGEQEGKCAVSACNDDADKAQQIVDVTLEFVNFCVKLVEGSDSESSSSAGGGISAPTGTFLTSSLSTATSTSSSTSTSTSGAGTSTTSAGASGETGTAVAVRSTSSTLAIMAVALMSVIFAASMA